MDEATFNDYIRRFNRQDDTAFDDYLHPDLHMRNGTLEFTGIDGMKHHYRDLIWGHFTEQLTVRRFVGDGRRIAIQMNALFTAVHDDNDSLFGPVLENETFAFDGLIMYETRDGLLQDITVAYNTFIFTDQTGSAKDLGIPH